MRKQDPNTHCFAVRCPLQEAAKIVTKADSTGITASQLIASAASTSVKDVTPSAKALKWANERRKVYQARRRKMDLLYGKGANAKRKRKGA